MNAILGWLSILESGQADPRCAFGPRRDQPQRADAGEADRRSARHEPLDVGQRSARGRAPSTSARCCRRRSRGCSRRRTRKGVQLIAVVDPAVGADRGRCAAAAAGAVEPRAQRDQVHAERRPRRGPGPARRRPAADHRRGQRPGHLARHSCRTCSSGFASRTRRRRARPSASAWACRSPNTRRAPRRHHRRAQRRRGPGCDVRHADARRSQRRSCGRGP